MKKLLPALVFILFSINSFADWDMLVCGSMDDKGNCIGKSTAFNLTDQELQLKVILANTEGLHTNKVYFEIYLMDPNTYAEDLKSTEETKTEPAQKMVYHSLSINQKGHYLIKVRDAFKDYITSREIEVK